MINVGFLDWAASVPAPARKTTLGALNTVTGIVVHSAEGYRAGMANVLADVRTPLSKRASWHLSVYKDGRVEQHYNLRAIAWHATEMNPFTIGIECEGIAGEPLTAEQIASVKRIINDVSEWQGWEPKRPVDKLDPNGTLFEHNEAIWWGGSPTACPSGRIPWDKILEADVEEPHFTRIALLDNVLTLQWSDGRKPWILTLLNTEWHGSHNGDIALVADIAPPPLP